jgi:hypothetical protein
LALVLESVVVEFVAKAGFIDGFQEPWAKGFMYAYGQADDAVREFGIVDETWLKQVGCSLVGHGEM